MGQLVFQAALGGQVNLVGPNTASTYNINVPATAGNMVTTGDSATVTSAMISGPLTTAVGGTGLTSFTANGVTYASSTSALTTGAGLTFDGTNFATTGKATAASLVPTGSTVPTNGMYLPAANTIGFATNSVEAMRIDSSGKVGIGASSVTNAMFLTAKAPTGNTVISQNLAQYSIQSDVTSQMRSFASAPSTVATAFTLSNLYGFFAGQGTIGAGSAVTNQYGFAAEASLTGATNNYGFYGNIASGTNRWNLYMNGTAENYLANNLKIGGTAARGTTAGTNQVALFDGTAPAGTLTNGVSLYSASGDLNFMDATGSAYKVGFRNIPINSQSAAYTTVLSDSGKVIFHPSTDANARTFTIDSNANVPYDIGTAITFINMSANVVTIAITSDTLYLAGTGSTGSRSLAQYGMATAVKMTSTTWIISGSGLT